MNLLMSFYILIGVSKIVTIALVDKQIRVNNFRTLFHAQRIQ